MFSPSAWLLLVFMCVILRAGAATNELLRMNYKAMLMRRGNVLKMQSGCKLEDNNQQASIVWQGRQVPLWNNVWCGAILRAGMDQPYFFGEIFLTVHNRNCAKQKQSQWLDLVMRLATVQGSIYKEWQNSNSLHHPLASDSAICQIIVLLFYSYYYIYIYR